MASNKVGHFIYKLYDRVWPYFICRFHLHKPSHGASGSLGVAPSELISQEEHVARETPAHLRLAIKPDLRILESNANGDVSASKELAKFGFSRIDNAG